MEGLKLSYAHSFWSGARARKEAGPSGMPRHPCQDSLWIRLTGKPDLACNAKAGKGISYGGSEVGSTEMLILMQERPNGSGPGMG